MIIYIDMDGVMADFAGHLQATGMQGADGRPRWNDMSRAWWASIPPIPGAFIFYSHLAARAEVRFLTAPVLSSDCFSGKADWVQRFLPAEGKYALKRLMIVSSKDKQQLAAPGRILIDDRQINIDEWTAAGGIGILFTGDFDAVNRALEPYLRAGSTVTRPNGSPKGP